MIKDNIPVFDVTIDDAIAEGKDLGINRISLVANPAVLIKGVAFSNDEFTTRDIYLADDVKYRVAGPVLVPMDVFRKDNSEYYLRFSEKKVAQIAKKFMANLPAKNQQFNVDHTNETLSSFTLESMLCDTPNKVKFIFDEYGINVPKGTFFLVTQFTDKTEYERCVNEGLTSFSLEGLLGMELNEYFEQNKKVKQSEMTENNNNNNEQTKETKMGELNLPEGAKFQIEDKWYIVKDGQIVEYVEENTEMADIPDSVPEDVTEEKMAEDVAPVAPEVLPTDSEMITKTEVAAMLDELYAQIAELKLQIGELLTEEKTEEAEVMLTSHKLSSVEAVKAYFSQTRN